MKKEIAATVVACFIATIGFSQADTAENKTMPGIFSKLMQSAQVFQPDTTTPPDDKITRKIVKLRRLRGGFNINEAVDFKIEEEWQNKETPEAELEKKARFFKSGEGKRWLDNAATWVYRQQFSYKEIKKMVRFYKSAAGQKLAEEFPVIMIQLLKAAETIGEWYGQQKTAS